MSKKPLLFTPGPTRVAPEVEKVLALPMIHHRSTEFQNIFASLRKNLQRISKNDGESLILTASGTAAMEAAVLSLFESGDHVVIVEAGKFGQRWVELGQMYQLDASVIRKPWGQAVSVREVLSNVRSNTKGVLIQSCESSTGAFMPVEDIGQALKVHPHLLFVVDSITSFGIYPHDMKKHGMDVLICSSQKALMCPPGLATICLSHRAVGRLRKIPSLYLSLEHELQFQIKNRPAFTPAVSLVRGLEKATSMILKEGLPKRYKRHQRLQQITRECFTLLGMECFVADECASVGITSVKASSKWNLNLWLDELRKKYGIWIGAGQVELSGKIFRMAHMGSCPEKDLVQALKIIVKSLKKQQPTDAALKFLNKL